MTERNMPQEQVRAIKEVKIVTEQYLEEAPMTVALYYSGTTIYREDIALMLHPEIPKDYLSLHATAIGAVAKTVLDPLEYKAAISRRNAATKRGIVRTDISLERRHEIGEATIMKMGTEYLVRSHGHIPWTQEEVDDALILQDDPNFRTPDGRVKNKDIAVWLNEHYHEDIPDGFKKRNRNSVRAFFQDIKNGSPRGVHIPPSNSKYMKSTE